MFTVNKSRLPEGNNITIQKISDEHVLYETCVTESKQELPIVCLDETRRCTKGRQDEAPSPSTAANSERREDASFIPSSSSSSGISLSLPSACCKQQQRVQAYELKYSQCPSI
jgi:hypothetical protein